MKVKYVGTHPEVKFRGIIFRHGESVEVGNKAGNFPADFEIDGKKPELSLYNEKELRHKAKSMGWTKFQKWAHDNFGVKDTSKTELIQEILDKQEGL